MYEGQPRGLHSNLPYGKVLKAEIMAVNHNNTINYVGVIGRMAFGSGTETVNGEKLLRIDYKKYASGEDEYYL